MKTVGNHRRNWVKTKLIKPLDQLDPKKTLSLEKLNE